MTSASARRSPDDAFTWEDALTTLFRAASRLLAFALPLLLVACAHPVSVQPDIRALTEAAGPRLPIALALHVAPEDSEREVTTAGGGGDSIRYFLYRDLEGAMVLALSRVFEKVVVVRRMLAGDELARDGFQLAVQPRFISASGSNSAFTWPPTFFSLSVTAAFIDAGGRTVSLIQESGSGKAEFAEFRTATGLAGQRAAADLLNRLAERLRKDPSLASVASSAPPIRP